METKNAPEIIEADYSAEQVADYFVHLASKEMVEEGVPEGVSPLKLQKYLYFAQAASLSLFNKKLFKDDIEAWKYGPVVSSIYGKYKSNLNQPLITPTGQFAQIEDENTKKFISEIWEMFRKYSASELVAISHNHTPWKSNYQAGENNVIPSEEIRDYYKNIFTVEGGDGEEQTAA